MLRGPYHSISIKRPTPPFSSRPIKVSQMTPPKTLGLSDPELSPLVCSPSLLVTSCRRQLALTRPSPPLLKQEVSLTESTRGLFCLLSSSAFVSLDLALKNSRSCRPTQRAAILRVPESAYPASPSTKSAAARSHLAHLRHSIPVQAFRVGWEFGIESGGVRQRKCRVREQRDCLEGKITKHSHPNQRPC